MSVLPGDGLETLEGYIGWTSASAYPVLSWPHRGGAWMEGEIPLGHSRLGRCSEYMDASFWRRIYMES